MQATGWQPYSLKVGNKYVPYHRFEPMGLTMGLIADTIHGMKTGDDPEVTQSKADSAVAHIIRNVSDLPFLFQLSQITDALKDTSGKRVQNFIARQIASLVPAGIANIAEGIDPTVRHPQGVVQTLESRIPGLTKNVPAVRDIVGKPVQRPASQIGGANPFAVTTAKNDPVVNELARLGVSTPALPTSVKLGKKTVTLTDEESQKLAEWEGQQLYARLLKAVTQNAWKNAPDEKKQSAIKSWHGEIRRALPYQLHRIQVLEKGASGLGPSAPSKVETPEASATHLYDPKTKKIVPIE